MSHFTVELLTFKPLSICAGYPRAVGTAPTDLKHHQTGAEEKPTGRVGRLKVL